MTQYKLVLVEPTEEMVRALRFAMDDEHASHKEWLRCVIAAAPEVSPWVSVKERKPEKTVNTLFGTKVQNKTTCHLQITGMAGG